MGGFEVGDKVKAVAKFDGIGQNIYWNHNMSDYIGMEGEVYVVRTGYIGIKYPDGELWSWPYDVIDKIEDDVLDDVLDEPSTLTMKFSGIEITLDASIPFSRNFAEAFLNAIYNKEEK